MPHPGSPTAQDPDSNAPVMCSRIPKGRLAREFDGRKFPRQTSNAHKVTVSLPPDNGRSHALIMASDALMEAVSKAEKHLGNPGQSSTHTTQRPQRQELLDEVRNRALVLVRRACSNCDEHQAEMAAMANALNEELINTNIRNGSIAERQRVLHGSGRPDEAALLTRAYRASAIVTNGFLHLHAHASHATPERAIVEPVMYALSRRP